MLVHRGLCIFFHCRSHIMLLWYDCLLSQGALWDLWWLLATPHVEVGEVCCPNSWVLRAADCTVAQCLKISPRCLPFSRGIKELCRLGGRCYISTVIWVEGSMIQRWSYICICIMSAVKSFSSVSSIPSKICQKKLHTFEKIYLSPHYHIKLSLPLIINC